MVEPLAPTRSAGPGQHALAYAELDWRVLPIKPGQKRPPMPEWQKAATVNRDMILSWFKELYRGYGVGIATGMESDVWVLDIDVGPDKFGGESLEKLEREHSPLPATVEAVTGSGGRHLYFRWPEGRRVITRRDTRHVGSPLPAGIDVRGEGGQVLAPPTVHPSGTRYLWREGHSPWDLPVAEAPAWLLAIVCEPFDEPTPIPSSAPTGLLADDHDDSIAEWFNGSTTWDALLTADGWTGLRPFGDEQYWVRPGKQAKDGHSAVLHLDDGPFVIFSTDGSLSRFAVPEARIATGDGWSFSKFGYYAIKHHNGDRSAAARELRTQRNRQSSAGQRLTVEADAAAADAVAGWEIGALPDGFRATDAGNAERLIAAADGCLRFVRTWGKWIVYRDGRWIIDNHDVLVTEAAKQVARRLLAFIAETEPGDGREKLFKLAKHCETAAGIANMVRLARGIPGVDVSHEELDAQPHLLNVLNGTVDLRTGELHPALPDDLLTKQAPVMFEPEAHASLWESCVARWQPEVEVREFLQRVIGSGAFGHPVEALIVNVGTGGNGKSRCFGTVAHVLGEYVVEPHKSLLVSQRHEQHPTVVASLFGARLLIASETDDGDRLDETQVKNLTGGDRLRARRMREDEWSFLPTHTAFLHTNHRPRIRGTDEGIWRRLKIVPWLVSISEDERDDHLSRKLQAEASGILNWIVAGCLAWQERGLDEPAVVLEATGDYRSSEDHLGRFLEDCCTIGPRWSVTAKALRETYEKWCSEAGENPISARSVGRELTGRGFSAIQLGRAKTRGWKGLCISEGIYESPGSDVLRTDADASPVSPLREPYASNKPEHPPASVRGVQVFDDDEVPF